MNTDKNLITQKELMDILDCRFKDVEKYNAQKFQPIPTGIYVHSYVPTALTSKIGWKTSNKYCVN